MDPSPRVYTRLFRRWLPTLLAALVVAFDLALASWLDSLTSSPPDWFPPFEESALLRVVEKAFILSHASLLGLWTGLSSARWFLRLPAVAIGVAAVSVMIDGVFGPWLGDGPILVRSLVGVHVYCVAVSLLLLRMLGLRVLRTATDKETRIAQRAGFQFSSFSLIAAVTGAAIALACLRPLFALLCDPDDLSTSRQFATAGVCLAMIPLAAVWAAFGAIRLRWRILWMIGVVVGLALTLNRLVVDYAVVDYELESFLSRRLRAFLPARTSSPSGGYRRSQSLRVSAWFALAATVSTGFQR